MTKSPPEEIRILHLRDSPWVCGPGRTILETGVTIDRSRFRYIVGALTSDAERSGELYEEAVRRQIPAYRIHETSRLDRGALREILRIIDLEKVDILHTHELRSDILGYICARRQHIAVISTLHGWIRNDLKNRAFVWLDKQLVRHFDHIIAVSELIAEEMRGHGTPEERLSVVNNAIVLDRLTPDPSDRSFREEIGATDGTLVIAKIGRLSREKGHPDLFAALKEVVAVHPDCKLALVGIGPDKETLKARARSYGLEQKIHFTGYRQDMERIYNGANLVVQSSLTEGMPNVVIESLLMKKPVIATSVGGTPEIIRDGANGILVRPGHPEELARAIILFTREPQKFHGMVEEGRKTIVEQFSFDNRSRRLEQIYLKVMNRRARP
jgi:glycosyltransferase involved in cell wall biosynthesis